MATNNNNNDLKNISINKTKMKSKSLLFGECLPAYMYVYKGDVNDCCLHCEGYNTLFLKFELILFPAA